MALVIALMVVMSSIAVSSACLKFAMVNEQVTKTLGSQFIHLVCHWYLESYIVQLRMYVYIYIQYTIYSMLYTLYYTYVRIVLHYYAKNDCYGTVHYSARGWYRREISCVDKFSTLKRLDKKNFFALKCLVNIFHSTYQNKNSKAV